MPRVPCVCPCVHPSCLCGQSALRHPGIACVHAFAPTHHRLSLSRVQWSATAASVVPCVRLSFVSHHHPCRPPLRCSCTVFQHSSQHRREQPPAPLAPDQRSMPRCGQRIRTGCRCIRQHACSARVQEDARQHSTRCSWMARAAHGADCAVQDQVDCHQWLLRQRMQLRRCMHHAKLFAQSERTDARDQRVTTLSHTHMCSLPVRHTAYVPCQLPRVVCAGQGSTGRVGPCVPRHLARSRGTTARFGRVPSRAWHFTHMLRVTPRMHQAYALHMHHTLPATNAWDRARGRSPRIPLSSCAQCHALAVPPCVA